jgi:hypothetical protein
MLLRINLPDDPLAGVGGAKINLDNRDDDSVPFSQIIPNRISGSDELDDSGVDVSET